MRPKLIFATLNKHKFQEVQALLADQADILEIYEGDGPLPETQDSIKGNALQKARFVYDQLKKSCFADDTGLEITALKGEPGVYSARYAKQVTAIDQTQANIELVLEKMQGAQDRSAQFRTVIALVDGPREIYFQGIVRGEILAKTQGNEGFGYDPIFKPEGYGQSFAEMTLTEKNKISHRAQAFRLLQEYLEQVSV